MLLKQFYKKKGFQDSIKAILLLLLVLSYIMVVPSLYLPNSSKKSKKLGLIAIRNGMWTF